MTGGDGLAGSIPRGRSAADVAAFEAFVRDAEPRLRRALGLLRGRDAGQDATSEALTWAWEHWPEVEVMANPVGYLYRVGVSRTRGRKAVFPPLPDQPGASAFEPGLGPALARLTDRQRTAVVLIYGCGWTHAEVADALGLSRSAVANHAIRALTNLRSDLGADDDR